MTDAASGLIDYLRTSPSPFHACATTAGMLRAAGFTPVAEYDAWPREHGRYYLVRGGSLVAWSTECDPAPTAGFRVVGAHTDSPNLRIKPRPDKARNGFQQLGVEVYGGPLLNSWLDRDLGISGRVTVRRSAARALSALDTTGYDAVLDPSVTATVLPDPGGADGPETSTVLVHLDEPLLRVAQLAIHMDRSVNSDGLRLNAQQHLSPIWGLGDDQADFAAFLAERIGVDPADVLAYDIMTHDVQPPARIGRDGEFIAGGRMDNLATAYAGTRALIEAVNGTGTGSMAGTGDAPAVSAKPGGTQGASYLGGSTPVLVLFDHEEVGSVSERGAQSSLLPTALERIVASRGGSREDFHRAIAHTIVASGDMAHATHPNYADKHEPEHQISINGGPVLKVNNQLRYATGSPGAAAFRLACEQARVPMQQFVTRSDLPCGSTVGPVTAARTGAETVDFGAAMLSMHSAREMVGAADQRRYIAALTAFLAPA